MQALFSRPLFSDGGRARRPVIFRGFSPNYFRKYLDIRGGVWFNVFRLDV